ncbi:MAG: CRISPR-associated protein Cas4 [Anaerolineales bacterium]
MLLLAGILLVLGLLALWVAKLRRERLGLPRGRVTYLDTDGLGHVERPLYDPALDLTGRPDYLVKQGERLVPVEVKSGHGGASPYPAHVLQLAAYCLLVEATYRTRPAYGIIRYTNRSFEVDYSPSLENRLLDVVAEIRRAEARGAPGRSHESAGRCRACGYRNACDLALR